MPGTELPENGDVRVGNVQLPAGRQVVAGYGSGGPVAWATLQPVADPGRIWQALSDIAPDTGLVPFLLSGLDETTARPWDEDEFSDPRGHQRAHAPGCGPTARQPVAWRVRGR